MKNIFLERYINYYVKQYHYTRIITPNKNTKINFLPDPTAMEKLAIERKQQEKPDFNCAALVQVVCVAAIFEYPSLF